MSGRRTVPPISPNDLRDHADEERIGRIWERIEHNLSGAAEVQSRRPRKRELAITLLAASLATFGGGVLLGKLVYDDRSAVTVPSAAPADRPVFDVFAAGSQPRAFALPGGGEIRLKPGATVEVERGDGDSLTLRLVQGEAMVDAAPRSADLALVAGDARLASSAGSRVVVRRGLSHMDVEVDSGSVSIDSPNGNQRLVAGQRDEVPLHTKVTTNDTPKRRDRTTPTIHAEEPSPAPEPTTVAVAAPPPDWRALAYKGDAASALKLLREQPGGIGGAIDNAKSASDLMAIRDAASGKGGDPDAAMRAQREVVRRFPKDPNAAIAAADLEKFYRNAAARSGDPVAKAEAERWAARRKELESALPPGVLGTDEKLCREFRTAHSEGRKDEAIRLAQEYLTKYPNGPCRDYADPIAKGEDLASDDEGAAKPDAAAKPADAKPEPKPGEKKSP